MAAAKTSSPKAKAKPTVKPKAKSTRTKAPKMTERDLFWRKALIWLARVLLVFGGLTAGLGVLASGVGLFVAGPMTALTLDVQTIWYHAHNFSLDLFQVLIERKLFFWLPNPTDAWFNVVRPVLFRTPVQLFVVGAIFVAFGWGIRRVLRS